MSIKKLLEKSMKIIYKTPSQIKLLKEWWIYHNELLQILYDAAIVGVRLSQLEKIALEYLISHKIKSAFKWFHGFPAQTCLSVNNCLVHGLPDEYTLKSGDLLKIDIGIIYKGMVTDAAVSKVIGGHQSNKVGAELMRATKAALDESLHRIKPWVSLMEYGRKVETFVIEKWFSIIRSLTGHGVWTGVHEDPRIANYADHRLKHITFKPGMVVALEPITAEYSVDYTTHANKRNLMTTQWDLWCQREYTIVVTTQWVEILAGLTSV